MKHQYLEGSVYAMVGDTNQHIAIAAIALLSLGTQPRGKPCRPFNSDTKVRFEYADLHQSLVFRISRFTSFDSARSLADLRLHIQSRRTVRLTITAAAAALILVGVVLKMTLVPATALATYRPAHGSLYTIEHSAEKDRSAGMLDEQSIVNLSQGTLEFTFRNGNRGVVLAPAKFELRTEKELLLREGTTWFEVSEKGKGFRVITEDLVVTDLGTEFGILAGPETGHEVHVFSGRVQARAAQGAAELLSAGHARRSGPEGRLEAIPVKRGNFLTRLPEPPKIRADDPHRTQPQFRQSRARNRQRHRQGSAGKATIR